MKKYVKIGQNYGKWFQGKHIGKSWKEKRKINDGLPKIFGALSEGAPREAG